jgi:hypothetical protein
LKHGHAYMQHGHSERRHDMQRGKATLNSKGTPWPRSEPTTYVVSVSELALQEPGLS